MSSLVSLSVAVLALIGTMGLALATATLFKAVRDVQDGLRILAEHQSVPAEKEMVLDEMKRDDGRSTILCVLSNGCSTCVERLLELESAVQKSERVEVVVVSAAGMAELPESRGRKLWVRPDLVGNLAVQATPAAIAFDASGRRLFQRVVASDRAMGSVIAWVNRLDQTQAARSDAS
jgi:G3E family GTPase